MTDDELRELSNVLIAELAPVRDLVSRVLDVVEHLQRRVEVLELERLHGRPTGSDYTARPD